MKFYSQLISERDRIIRSVGKANAMRMINDIITHTEEKLRSGKVWDPDEWEYGDGEQSRIQRNTIQGCTIGELYHSDFDLLIKPGRIASNWFIGCFNKDFAHVKHQLRREPRFLDKRETVFRYCHITKEGQNSPNKHSIIFNLDHKFQILGQI